MKSPEFFVEEGRGGALSCKHFFPLEEWRRHLHKEFSTGRKKPLGAIGCIDSKCSVRSIGADAFRALCDSDEERAHLESYLKTIPSTTVPKELGDFNYEYNKETGLLQTADALHLPFHYVSETHYAALGDLALLHIQRLMSQPPYSLKRVRFPVSSLAQEEEEEDSPGVDIWISPNLEQAERVVLVIQGSGAVRPGQWARALCLNQGILQGSILPYLDHFRARGWAVVVCNPNADSEFVLDTAELRRIEQQQGALAYWTNPSRAAHLPGRQISSGPANASPETHVQSIWDAYFAEKRRSAVAIVAHSYGGVATMSLLQHRGPQVFPLLKAVAFTDSVHSVVSRGLSPATASFLKSGNVVNWLKSHEPLDKPLQEGERHYGCECRSAGHPEHEWTSYSARESVFRFLDERIQ